MSHTATSIFGYGLKVNEKALYDAGLVRFLPVRQERVLDPEEFPLLDTGFSGWSPSEEHWVFVKSSMTRLYSGLSGNGMSATVNSWEISSEEQSQLDAWCKLAGQDDAPKMVLIQYFN